jgi:hypothetical protein
MQPWRQWWIDTLDTGTQAGSQRRMWDKLAAVNNAWWLLWRSSFTAPWTRMPWPPAGQVLPPEVSTPAEVAAPVLGAARGPKRKRPLPQTPSQLKRMRHP